MPETKELRQANEILRPTSASLTQEVNFKAHGADEVWRQWQREGIEVVHQPVDADQPLFSQPRSFIGVGSKLYDRLRNELFIYVKIRALPFDIQPDRRQG